MSKDIKGYECKFAIHIPKKHFSMSDVHMVKEIIHYADGSTEPNLRLIKDFKRPFWITAPKKQNHQQKKELEHIDNLIKKEATQSDLTLQVAKALGKSWSNDHLKKLSSSPYLYGTDISSTTIINKTYKNKYEGLATPNTVAMFDIETDVINGTQDPIMITVVFKDLIFTAVLGDFVSGYADIEAEVNKAARKYISEYLTKHNFPIELYVAKDVIDLIKTTFNKIHDKKPDVLGIWNMDFDIPKILNALEKYGVDPKEILCDPKIPDAYKICKYIPGKKKKITSSGKVTPINPSSQWHTLLCTSSYYVLDAMCCYKQIRTAEQEEPSYKLDAILNKELGIRKLNFKEADGYNELAWHQFMQTNYKVEYIIYNMFDCISMVELDDKTNDLTITIPASADTTDFSNFKSQPKRISDALFWYQLDKGYILGTVGYTDDEDDVELDENGDIIDGNTDILSLKGWIITLPAHMSVLGLNCIEDDPTIKTGVRTHVFDSDAVSAYPTSISINNVSRSTTKKELINIEGIDETVFRMNNLNFMLGGVNSLDYCVNMFRFPKPEELLKKIK